VTRPHRDASAARAHGVVAEPCGQDRRHATRYRRLAHGTMQGEAAGRAARVASVRLADDRPEEERVGDVISPAGRAAPGVSSSVW